MAAGVLLANWKPDEADRYVLALIYETGFLQEQHIRALYNLSRGAASERVNRLLAAGLVERLKPDSSTRRALVPYLYQVTRSAHEYLPAPPSGRYRRHIPIEQLHLNSTTTGHPIAVAELAVAVLGTQLQAEPEVLALDWWGEHRTQIKLAPDKLHPQAEMWLKPDGMIRVLDVDDKNWAERHRAQALSAWWVEVDRGTEDSKDWDAKLSRYARALSGRAWQTVLGDMRTPGLLITLCNQVEGDGDMLSRALWISHAAAAMRLPPDWLVWIAQHREVLEPEGLAAPVWRQVYISANSTEQNVLAGAASLHDILAPQRPFPVQRMLFERAEKQRLMEEARKREEQERAERQRQKELAASSPAPVQAPQDARSADIARRAAEIRQRHKNMLEHEAILVATHDYERQEWSDKQDAIRAERERLARAAEAERRRAAAAEAAYRRTLPGRWDTLVSWWKRARVTHKLINYTLWLIGFYLWLWVYLMDGPTFAQITDQRNAQGVGFFGGWRDYYASPQLWLLVIVFGAASMAVVIWLGDAAISVERLDKRQR